MNKHLFKLKKYGKTVGYLKIDRDLVCWRHTTLSTALNKTWHTVHNSARIDFDTAHPFVTKDKNGNDVFAGDRIKRVTAEGCFDPSRKAGREGIVVWHHGFLQWSLKVGTENSYLMEDLADSEIFEAEIELIEDKNE